MAKKVVVVRVGTKTIYIVHMENTVSNPTVYGCVRVPVPEGSVNEGLIENVGEVARRIKKACTEKGIRTKDVIFTVASSKIASRETEIPVVNKTKISQLVMAKVPDLFPVDTDKYIFSHVQQGGEREDEENGKVLDVRVFAAPAELIDSYYTLADALGMNIVAIDADANGVFQVMKRQVKEGVSMSLQITRNNTLINIISSDKLLLQRVVPYGVNAFAEVMMQEEVFQAPDFERAYKMLTTQKVLLHNLNMENPKEDFSLGKRIEVTDNGSYLISNINRVIEYYNSRYKDQPITNILCTGLGCSVAGIHELLSNELGIPVTTPNVIQGVRFNRKVSIDAAILQYLNCFGSVFSPVKFVPREIARKEAEKGSLTLSGIIFAGCLLISAILAGLSIYQVIVTGDERDYWKSRNEALAPVQNEYDALTKIETNFVLYKQVANLVDTNNNKLHSLINKFSAMCPKSFKIQSIRSDEQEVTISATSTERLLSLSALKIQLEKIKEIDEVWIDAISESTEALTNKRQYSYTLTFVYANTKVQSDEEGAQ
ncbi:MAG: pilus assembly protein PilM [Lachnospiraceae bacterium]|nr:pilus assembly protein PilM [Lachnospiraceae bacterium]